MCVWGGGGGGGEGGGARGETFETLMKAKKRKRLV